MAYTAPRTWVTGELVTAALLNQDIRDNQLAAFPLGVDAWTAFTPTLTQSVTVTKTMTWTRYTRVGRLITAQYDLAVTGAGTAGNTIVIGLPVNAAAAGGAVLGMGVVYDASATAFYKGIAELESASTFRLASVHVTTLGALGAVSFTAALASGDIVRAQITYQAAT